MRIAVWSSPNFNCWCTNWLSDEDSWPNLRRVWLCNDLKSLMAHWHCTGPEPGPGNNGFIYYTMYCTHYTGTQKGRGNHCFLLCPSRSLSLPRYWPRLDEKCQVSPVRNTRGHHFTDIFPKTRIAPIVTWDSLEGPLHERLGNPGGLPSFTR